MTAPPTPPLSPRPTRPQGPNAGHVGLGRAARGAEPAPSATTHDASATLPAIRGRRGSLPYHLIRITAITFASMLVAVAVIVAGLRMAVADRPDPWDAVLGVLAQAFARAAAFVAAASAVLGGLTALALVVLLLYALAARTARWLRPEPDRAPPNRPTHPSTRT